MKRLEPPKKLPHPYNVMQSRMTKEQMEKLGENEKLKKSFMLVPDNLPDLQTTKLDTKGAQVNLILDAKQKESSDFIEPIHRMIHLRDGVSYQKKSSRMPHGQSQVVRDTSKSSIMMSDASKILSSRNGSLIFSKRNNKSIDRIIMPNQSLTSVHVTGDLDQTNVDVDFRHLHEQIGSVGYYTHEIQSRLSETHQMDTELLYSARVKETNSRERSQNTQSQVDIGITEQSISLPSIIKGNKRSPAKDKVIGSGYAVYGLQSQFLKRKAEAALLTNSSRNLNYQTSERQFAS